MFQDIFDKLQDVMPKGWKRVAFLACYTNGSYSMKYYVDNGQSGYVDCFTLYSNNTTALIKLFMSIDKIISAERNALDENERWSVISMVVDYTGNMKTEFDYADINENTISYEDEWKQKNLT